VGEGVLRHQLTWRHSPANDVIKSHNSYTTVWRHRPGPAHQMIDVWLSTLTWPSLTHSPTLTRDYYSWRPRLYVWDNYFDFDKTRFLLNVALILQWAAESVQKSVQWNCDIVPSQRLDNQRSVLTISLTTTVLLLWSVLGWYMNSMYMTKILLSWRRFGKLYQPTDGHVTVITWPKDRSTDQ